ncbi:MAG TPA: phosphoribosylaminoimidazolesuccinocarboxamide synthase [Planctomycetaceae bacterium]|nr:phosphoribosylaminoimidazolesuccinocarboxamide synthase [Planctomycetaceae bacterium]HRF02863.1 phosphoribosylaminoimidazolesuccinocarboxamide synthase [Pirellulaceae bacterium]
MPATLIRQGKVRDLYDLGDRLLLVASDRISAFDWILPTAIPDKGRVLTGLTRFWLERLGIPNHLLSFDVAADEVPVGVDPGWLVGRSMVVRKCRVVQVECVVRGYLVGSGWKDYQATGQVCGLSLPPGLINCDRLETPLFTPAAKNDHGHDENIAFEQVVSEVGLEVAAELRDRSLEVYRRGRDIAAERGIIIADTKFEWGFDPAGNLLIVDEVLTPDSSRFWPADSYRPGANPPSFDKQFVRDWLEGTTWDKNSPPPELPSDVVARTRGKYVEAYERLTGERFPF